MLKEVGTHGLREYLGESGREIKEVSLVTDRGGKVEDDGLINWHM